MGFLDSVKSQFIDVVEYLDDSDRVLIYKYTRPGDEIKQGAKAIVRESQAAVFIKGGELADILFPGTHKLDTDNLPFLSTLGAFPYLFNSPIKSDLYFVSLKQFIDNPWETKNPVMKRDKDFNMVRIRAAGKFAFRVADVELFMEEVFGAQHKLESDDIIGYLSSIVLEAFAVTLGESELPVLDLAMRYRGLSDAVEEAANATAHAMGIAFSNVVIESITLPEAVEKLIDEQSGIGMASKNMDTFLQYQTARAMRDASRQEGGLAGLGAGLAFGNTIAAQAQTGAAAPGKSIPADELRALKGLLDDGILTQEEFDLKKKQILGL